MKFGVPFIFEINKDGCCSIYAENEQKKAIIAANLLITLLELDCDDFEKYLSLNDFFKIKNGFKFVKDFLAFMYLSYPLDEIKKAKNNQLYLNELQIKRENWFRNFKQDFDVFFCDKKKIKDYLIDKNFIVTSEIKKENDEYRAYIGFHCVECFVYWALWQYSNSDIELSQCQNCGKYFIPHKRNDEKYCDRKNNNGKTCKQIGYVESKLKNDPIMSTYRKIYKTQNARKQRNKDNIKDLNKKFTVWRLYAEEQLKLCKSGGITLEEMKSKISNSEWIKEDFETIQKRLNENADD